MRKKIMYNHPNVSQCSLRWQGASVW